MNVLAEITTVYSTLASAFDGCNFRKLFGVKGLKVSFEQTYVSGLPFTVFSILHKTV